MGTKAFESLLEATKAINQGEVKYLGPRYIEDFYNRSCIYFLTNNQSENKPEVVYVGQTKSLGNRLGAHYSDQKKYLTLLVMFLSMKICLMKWKRY